MISIVLAPSICFSDTSHLFCKDKKSVQYFGDREYIVTSMLDMDADLLFLSLALWKL